MPGPRAFAAGLGVALALGGCGGTRAPALAAPDLKNRVVSLEDYRGKAVLLWFWASWSPPSRIALPGLAKLQRTWGHAGFQVLAVAVQDDPKLVAAAVRGAALNFPVLLGTTRVDEAYFPSGEVKVPTGVLMDGDRRIAARYTGYQPVEAIEPDVARLLGGPAAGSAGGEAAPAKGGS